MTTLEPNLMAWILSTVFDVPMPFYHHARTHSTDVRVMKPATYRADGIVLFCDPLDKPLLAAVLEIQMGRKPEKRRTWGLYVAQLEAELRVDVALVIMCADVTTADWCRRLVNHNGPSALTLRPLVCTLDAIPLITDVRQARSDPALTVLAVVCHGGQDGVDDAFPALREALLTLGPDKALPYNDVVLGTLPEATRTRWEEYMNATARDFYSDTYRRVQAEGEARGQAEGEARGRALGEANAVLAVLEARGLTVAEDIRERIETSTDLDELDTWIRRAATATTIDDLFQD